MSRRGKISSEGIKDVSLGEVSDEAGQDLLTRKLNGMGRDSGEKKEKGNRGIRESIDDEDRNETRPF